MLLCNIIKKEKEDAGINILLFFHTSHPQLCGYLRNSKKWVQNSAKLHGDNKARSRKSMIKSQTGIGQKKIAGGFGGHFRAIQGFKYIGDE